jgi:2-polyprenyl-6-methoxyphenol hydroxylase-like FAD-dependent oxidoreductase
MKAMIIGGGIGGVAAAIALRRVGVECDIFEQAEELREVGAHRVTPLQGAEIMIGLCLRPGPPLV